MCRNDNTFTNLYSETSWSTLDFVIQEVSSKSINCSEIQNTYMIGADEYAISEKRTHFVTNVLE